MNCLPSGDVIHKLMFVNVTRGEKLSPVPQYSACSGQSFLGVTVEHRSHVHADSRDILKIKISIDLEVSQVWYPPL